MGFKEARERAGLSPVQAAERLKVSLATVYHWESGAYRPTGKRLLEIAALYQCSVDELLGICPVQKNQRDRPA